MTTPKKTIVYFVHCIVVLFLLFGFKTLPAPAPLTSDGMAVFGILLGLIYGWSFCGLIWPSLFGIVSISVNGLMTMKETLISSFGNDTIWLIAFLLIVSAMIDEARLPKVVAMWILTKKIFYGKPWLFSFAYIFVAFILSATTHVMAAIVICWGILYQICGKLGYGKRDAYAAYMVLGTVVGGMLGTAIFPFKPLPYSIMALYANTFGQAIGFGTYMAFSAITCILVIIIFCLVGKFILRIDAMKLKMLDENCFEPDDFNFRLTKQQKVACVTLLIMVVLLLFPSILPASVPVLGFFKGLGLAGTMIFITAALVMIRIDGNPILQFAPMANKGLQWGVILLVASLMPMGTLIPMESTGIQPWLLSVLMPIFNGKPTILYLTLLVVIIIIMTNYFNNAVVGALFVLATTPITMGMGMNPSMMAIIIAFTVHLALISPAGSVWSALLFNNLEWISTKQIYLYGVPNLIICALIIIGIGFVLC